MSECPKVETALPQGPAHRMSIRALLAAMARIMPRRLRPTASATPLLTGLRDQTISFHPPAPGLAQEEGAALPARTSTDGGLHRRRRFGRAGRVLL